MIAAQGTTGPEDEVDDLRYPLAAPWSRFAQRFSAVAWPAFLMAGVLEMLVFTFVDPEQLRWLGGASVELSRTAVYTLSFFAFWVIISLSGGLTQLLLREPADIDMELARRRFP